MDFMKLLRSFEEFIFEAVSWLVFYPVTVWRIVTRPLATMAYSDAEQQQAEEGRYCDALSPPLLLLFTVVMVSALGILLHTADPKAVSKVTEALLASPQNITLFRALAFSLVPLVAAVTLLRRTGTKLSRETLRAPFYAQCYLATPCCIVIGLGFDIFHRADLPDELGATLLLAGSAWFFVTQTRWFRSRLGVNWGNAAWTAVWALARAAVYMFTLLIPVALI